MGQDTGEDGEDTAEEWYLSQSEINAMKIDELKKEILRRGVKWKGRKDELQKQLHNCME